MQVVVMQVVVMLEVAMPVVAMRVVVVMLLQVVTPRVVVLVVGGERGAAGSGHRAAGAHQRQHQAGPGERGESGGEAAGGSAVRAAVSAGSRYEHGRLPLRRLRGELSGSGRLSCPAAHSCGARLHP